MNDPTTFLSHSPGAVKDVSEEITRSMIVADRAKAQIAAATSLRRRRGRFGRVPDNAALRRRTDAWVPIARR